jgi:predicted O-methyltransferase YrrM
MREDYGWNSIVRETYVASKDLGIPIISMDDGYVLYSTAFLTALRFGQLKAMDAGAGVGFSTIWIAKAILESGVDGKVYAVEKAIRRFRKLEKLIAEHRLEHLVIPVNTDALEYVKKVEKLNFVFVDIEKDHYLEFFRLVEGKILKGGVMLAHNVKHPYGTVDAFLSNVSRSVWKTIVVPTGAGISISIKTGQ